MKSKTNDLTHKLPGGLGLMPSKSKSFECISYDQVTGPGLVWPPKTPQASVVNLAIPLPLVWTEVPQAHLGKSLRMHMCSSESLREFT